MRTLEERVAQLEVSNKELRKLLAYFTGSFNTLRAEYMFLRDKTEIFVDDDDADAENKLSKEDYE